MTDKNQKDQLDDLEIIKRSLLSSSSPYQMANAESKEGFETERLSKARIEHIKNFEKGINFSLIASFKNLERV